MWMNVDESARCNHHVKSTAAAPFSLLICLHTFTLSLAVTCRYCTTAYWCHYATLASIKICSANGDFSAGTLAPFAPPRAGIQLSLEGCSPGGDCSLRTDKVYWFDGPVVELPSICLRTMAAGTRWWIRYDVRVTDADGNAAD